MSDLQANKVYALEDVFVKSWLWYSPVAKAKALQAIADAECKRYKVKRVKVRVRRKAKPYYGEYGDGEIELGPHSRRRGHGANLPVLLHELAHHLVTCKCPRAEQDHGPEFVLYLSVLLIRYKVVDRTLWWKGLRKAKIKTIY